MHFCCMLLFLYIHSHLIICVWLVCHWGMSRRLSVSHLYFSRRGVQARTRRDLSGTNFSNLLFYYKVGLKTPVVSVGFHTSIYRGEITTVTRLLGHLKSLFNLKLIAAHLVLSQLFFWLHCFTQVFLRKDISVCF